MLGKGTVRLLTIHCILVIAAVWSAPKHDAIGSTVAAVAERRHPAHGIAGEKQQRNPAIAHLHDAVILTAVPVFVVSNADEAFASQTAIGRDHVAVRDVADIVAVLLEE